MDIYATCIFQKLWAGPLCPPTLGEPFITERHAQPARLEAARPDFGRRGVASLRRYNFKFLFRKEIYFHHHLPLPLPCLKSLLHLPRTLLWPPD